ncbi:MAG: arsenate reductase [Alcanivorax sp.]|nr:arsenate reductase [Alcanivorax sp.]
MTLTIYGIKACDTMKKAFVWLDHHDIAYTFHDYKKAGAPADRLPAWIKAKGRDTIINRRGTSWRKLPQAERDAMDDTSAVTAAVANPSLIKRPLVEYPGGMLVGFDPDAWAEALL